MEYNQEWLVDENMVYTLRPAVFMSKPIKENDYWFGVSNNQVSQAMRNHMADEIAKKLNGYDDLQAQLKAVCADIEELQNSLPKIKADAIREATKEVFVIMNLDPRAYDAFMKIADRKEANND